MPGEVYGRQGTRDEQHPGGSTQVTQDIRDEQHPGGSTRVTQDIRDEQHPGGGDIWDERCLERSWAGWLLGLNLGGSLGRSAG